MKEAVGFKDNFRVYKKQDTRENVWDYNIYYFSCIWGFVSTNSYIQCKKQSSHVSIVTIQTKPYPNTQMIYYQILHLMSPHRQTLIAQCRGSGHMILRYGVDRAEMWIIEP